MAWAALPLTQGNAQSPTATVVALPTYSPTDDGSDISIIPKTTTPAPTLRPRPTSTPGGTPFAPALPTKLKPPPTLDELLKQFPDLAPYINSNLTVDQIDMADLYKKLVAIYDKNGASGVAAFLKDSGLLEKLNLPVSYLDLLMIFDKEGLEGVLKLAKERGIISSRNELVAYITPAKADDVKQISDDMLKLGVSTYPPLNEFGQLEIGIPLDILSTYQTPGTMIKYLVTVATVKNVTTVSPPIPKDTSDTLDSMGAAYLVGVGPKFVGADAWHKAGITGKGIRVGVLDLGFGQTKDLMNGKDLPTDLQSAQDLDELSEDDEVHGTACAQVVFGMAPDAKIFIGMADTSSNFNQSINFFIKNKVHIITYSVGSAVGPRDGTFGDALVVDRVVEKTGILWLTAAGNEAENHTLFKFKDEDGDGAHDFDGENVLPFAAFAPSTGVTMNWNGNWKGGEKDEYTFQIFDERGREVGGASEAKRGRKNDFPFQFTRFRSTPRSKYFLVVRRGSKTTSEATIDVFVNNGLFPDSAQVRDRSVTTPADSNSSLTVGATGLTVDKIEDYSSQGPTMDGRTKPDVSAPTGEKLAVYKNGFNGTSGATPLVAGMAALYFQAFPDLTASEIRAAIQKSVVDLGPKGIDNVFGNGRVKLPDPKTIKAGQPPAATPEPGDGNAGQPAATVVPTRTARPSATPRAGAATSTPRPVGRATGTPSASRATATPVPEPEDGKEPTAELTDYNIKFNVKSGGVTGIQVSASFNIDNFKGRPGAIVLVFFAEDGETAIKPKTSKYQILGTLGTYREFSPKFASSSYSNVTLFLPNSEFGNLPRGESSLTYIVAVLDITNEKDVNPLAVSDPEPVTVKR
jgi:hypothetical protein